jgi:hypothetical protein
VKPQFSQQPDLAKPDRTPPTALRTPEVFSAGTVQGATTAGARCGDFGSRTLAVDFKTFGSAGHGL